MPTFLYQDKKVGGVWGKAQMYVKRIKVKGLRFKVQGSRFKIKLKVKGQRIRVKG